MNPIYILMSLFFVACNEPAKDDDSGQEPGVDLDQDGVSSLDGDCDDQDSSVYPGAEDSVGDGLDQNCDDSDGVDFDGDGYASLESGGEDCDDLDPDVSPLDQDNDGFGGCDGDCDDTDNDIYPGAQEICDEKDNDCNGDVDGDDAIDAPTWHGDADGDGYGDEEMVLLSCSRPSDYVANDDDCDDLDSEINPDAEERCDGIDNDCDGQLDEDDAIDALIWHYDADGDGFGDASITLAACTAPVDYVDNDLDCDDAASSINPDAIELCDLIDNNCDGLLDEDSAADAPYWFSDNDGDGYGDAAAAQQACEAPIGMVDNDLDCDDAQALTYPGADEYCDGVDNDCDMTVDEESLDSSLYYMDADGDGFGDATLSQAACLLPVGYVVNSTDCDDGNAALSPDASEMCDGIDNNCDGVVDESTAVDAPLWHLDADGDGHGAGLPLSACNQPVNYVLSDDDCNDSLYVVSPSAPERCSTVDDDDCDGVFNESDSIDALLYFSDVDGDGYGDAASTTSACSLPLGFVLNDWDCDDLNIDINPFSFDSPGDGIDQDCTGADSLDVDLDGDGFNDTIDCDDANASVYPGALENCDGVDNDCDVLVDEGVSMSVYVDLDGDGFGDPATESQACGIDIGFVDNGEDCNDADSAIHPNALELIADGVDTDCDGYETCFQDADLDLYGGSQTILYPALSCVAVGILSTSLDCDDGDATIHPGAMESFADGIDSDCDGFEACAVDLDGDGDGGTTISVSSDLTCLSVGFSPNDYDCNDADPSINANAVEMAADGIDQNCDALELCFADGDGDGYGTQIPAYSTAIDCQALGVSALDTDCDDTNEFAYPGVAYLESSTDCLVDSDGDGFGAEITIGMISSGTDCDDADASIHPNAIEQIGDGVDQNCDGLDDILDVEDLLPGDLVITEVMNDPSFGVSDTVGEWFELRLMASGQFDLNGLIISDNGSNLHTVSSSLIVNGGDLVLFARSSGIMDNGQPDYVYSSFTLNNSSDDIILSVVDAAGATVVIDELNYDSGFPGGAGTSFSLDPNFEDELANDDPSAWCDGVDPYDPAGNLGTPGEDNPDCP